MHYDRWKAHGDPLWTPEAKVCVIKDCGKPHLARGWCRRHYKVWEAHGDPEWVRPPAPECAVDTCDETSVARGWCHAHWSRWKETGDVRADVPVEQHARYEAGLLCAVETCTEPRAKKDWCDMHYRRYRRHGDPLKVLVIHGDDWTRIESYIDRSAGPDACWLWTGPTEGGGYGQTMLNGKLKHVHLLLWERENGPKPPGIEMDHECHNQAIRDGLCLPGICAHRRCCNLRHLVPRTRAEHVAASPGRSSEMRRNGRRRKRAA